MLASDESPGNGSAADDLFATETMAELCARQGRLVDAAGIYRRLLSGAVDANKRTRWESRLEELQRAPLIAAAGRTTTPTLTGGLEARPRAAAAGVLGARVAEPRGKDAPAAGPSADSGPALRLPLLVTQPVRSGQVVYAVKTDLIVVGPVNPGAQLMADGNIHVYGPLRGRAVAGATGCRQARIFCRHLEAELVGIDTVYLAREDLPTARIGRPAQVRFESDAAGERCVVADLP